MKHIFGLSILLTLAACNSGGGSGDSKTSQPVKAPSVSTDTEAEIEQEPTVETKDLMVVTKRKVQLEKDLSNLKDYKDSINSYELLFSAKSGAYLNTEIVCERKFFERSNYKYRGHFDHWGQEATVSVDILSEDKAQVDFKCTLTEEDTVIETVDIKILKSYVINGSQSLQAVVGTDKVAAIVLEDGAILSTNGDTITLQVEELVSNKGKIVTFFEHEATKAYDNRDGLSGGEINLTATKAFGEISFEMRGLNGGNKTNAIPERNTQIPAANPKNDRVSCGLEWPVPNACNGYPGDKGYRGLTGFQGHKGGNSGSLIFKTIKESDLSVEVLHFTGKGGLGGKGGPGGVGGPGGKGALLKYRDIPDTGGRCARCSDKSMNSSVKYHQYASGPQGPVGDVGFDGPVGETGKNSESVVTFSFEKEEHKILDNWKNF